jgi:murein DD-endopeptidase MepM/ murein hydrolase activator NlpD
MLVSSACSLRSADSPAAEPVLDEQTIAPLPSIAVDEDEEIPTPTGRSAKRSVDDNPQPQQGFHHTLRRGETLSSVSSQYQIPVVCLLRVNKITHPTRIRSGTRIFIPVSSAPADFPLPAMGELGWPLKGRITSDFGPRGKRSRHQGIDIDGQAGDEVVAAASGTVTEASTRGKYGKIVMITHADGLATLYAHLSTLLVRVGDWVERGDPIANVGRSGNARGTHLHFEVHRNEQPVNPIRHLDGGTAIAAASR